MDSTLGTVRPSLQGLGSGFRGLYTTVDSSKSCMTLVYYKSQCQRDMQYYGSAGLGESTVSLYELYGNNVLGALTVIPASTLLVFCSSLDLCVEVPTWALV